MCIYIYIYLVDSDGAPLEPFRVQGAYRYTHVYEYTILGRLHATRRRCGDGNGDDDLSSVLLLTLIYSMGQTAVASIPPAIHPAAMGSKGLFFLSVAMVKRRCSLYSTIWFISSGVVASTRGGGKEERRETEKRVLLPCR